MIEVKNAQKNPKWVFPSGFNHKVINHMVVMTLEEQPYRIENKYH